MKNTNLPRIHIICDVCQRPVDTRHMEEDYVNQKYIYHVRCHGADAQTLETPMPADETSVIDRTLRAYKTQKSERS
jgi:hypothetical protein